MKLFCGKNLMLFFLCSIFLSATAQPELDDAKQAYQYWAKRGIIEIIYSYMLDYSESNSLSLPDKDGMNLYKNKFISDINEKSLDDIDGLYDDLLKILIENSWEKTAENIAKPLMGKYERKSIIDSSFFSVLDSPGKHYLKTLDYVVGEYDRTIITFNDSPSTDGNLNKEPPITKGNKKRISKLGNYFYVFSAVFLGLIFGALLSSLYVQRKISQILTVEKKSYIQDLKNEGSYHSVLGFIGLVRRLWERKEDYKKESKQRSLDEYTVTKEFEILKNEVSKLSEENRKLKEVLEKLKRESISRVQEYSSKEPGAAIKNKLFYSIPQIDGSFKVDESRDHKEPDTFYMLEFADGNEGYVSFISGDYDLRAIENLDFYINPVCEVQNIGNRIYSKKVQMISRGTFIRNGNFWQVCDKIKINLV